MHYIADGYYLSDVCLPIKKGIMLETTRELASHPAAQVLAGDNAQNTICIGISRHGWQGVCTYEIERWYPFHVQPDLDTGRQRPLVIYERRNNRNLQRMRVNEQNLLIAGASTRILTMRAITTTTTFHRMTRR